MRGLVVETPDTVGGSTSGMRGGVDVWTGTRDVDRGRRSYLKPPVYRCGHTFSRFVPLPGDTSGMGVSSFQRPVRVRPPGTVTTDPHVDGVRCPSPDQSDGRETTHRRGDFGPTVLLRTVGPTSTPKGPCPDVHSHGSGISDTPSSVTVEPGVRSWCPPSPPISLLSPPALSVGPVRVQGCR